MNGTSGTGTSATGTSGSTAQPGSSTLGSSPLGPNERQLKDGTRYILSDGIRERFISGILHLPRGNPLGGPPIGFTGTGM